MHRVGIEHIFLKVVLKVNEMDIRPAFCGCGVHTCENMEWPQFPIRVTESGAL